MDSVIEKFLDTYERKKLDFNGAFKIVLIHVLGKIEEDLKILVNK